ncbi:MAG: hypothetical protein PVJ40_01580 [Gammaproteobacteria bacterium]|jgi:serine protease
MKRLGELFATLSLTLVAGAAMAAPNQVSYGSAGVIRLIEDGQPPVVIHRTVQAAENAHAAKGSHGKPGGGGGGGTATNNLLYGGGVGGVGVETSPKIYLVIWGSQWSGNDPSGEANLLTSFFGSIGGSSWFNSVTQYCQGVASGTEFCNGSGTAAGNPAGMFQGVWYDTASSVPHRPRQSDIAAEAVRAAQHFGNTAAGSNDSADYVIALPSGYSPQGFGTQYCAYHSYTSSSYGNVAYTNLPYITDAGSSCGAGFNGLGPNAGITMVSGHEVAEAASDQFPSGGWLDANGAENADKCAWISSGQGASANVTFPDGNTYAVQSLWSNAFNNGAGGCVMSY